MSSSKSINRPRGHNRRTRRFITMANNTNNRNRNLNRLSQIWVLNNADTIDRIIRIDTPQTMNNSLQNDFFNGTIFDISNDFETSILPTGCLPTSY
ncbi:hypothetical protein GLOIN_2v1769445 [Rhizophagus clarus]|uniref:Uncharacterized protein n=1 Tax=Rhizophagus clarus TaxID=94130 RepID=A0A8H3M2L2_9GLOM|nr:hypothetical protein GLOIN_2v1769445 [Rhizophagus clarus]